MFALATVAWGFTLFMLALMRVFLDPKLYASTSVRRVGGSDRRSARRDAEGGPNVEPAPAPLAEPFVPRYAPQIPEAVPVPAAAFAAVPYEAGAHGDGMNAGPVEYQPGREQGYADPYATQTYAQPLAQPMVSGNAAQDIYANPYANPYESQPQGQYQTEVPVLGTVPPQNQG
jgi:hypothetical protein